MAEESFRSVTQQDIQDATRLAAVEVHVHYIRETQDELKKALAAQAAVVSAMNESAKRTEIMLATLTANLTATKETVSTLTPIRDKVLNWSGSLGFLAAIVAFILWLLNRYFPVK